ncbi:hypothetical protein KSS87_021523 [Heliosperma pusillum]|nr:hypothetical protein KSS87_021523 [Heliosperma pusillum]
MKTQDREKLHHSGSNGHGGVHVCHTCGWPFPKPHPSSKHRKAHKRVCGTIEGYRLDNGVRDEARVEGDVVEPSSDDELKSPSKCEKVVERSLSRGASSGVSSKLSGSTISEEDVCTDDGTEINESSGTLRREESTGLLQRYYSMQNGNELDDTWPLDAKSAGYLDPTGGPAIYGVLWVPVSFLFGLEKVSYFWLFLDPEGRSDNLCTPNLPKGDKLQSTHSGEGENKKLEATAGSQDHISSETSKELDVVLEKGNVVMSSKDELDIRTSEKPEEVAQEVTFLKGVSDEVKEVSYEVKGVSKEVKGVSNEVLGSVNASVEDNKVKGVNDEVLGSARASVEDNKEGISNVDFPGKTQIGTDKDVYATPVTDLLSLQQPNVDINMLRSDIVKDLNNDTSGEDGGISSEEKKPVKLLEKVFPEGVTMDAAHIQDTTANKDFSVNDDGSEVSEKKISMSSKPAIDEVPSQELELISTSDNIGMCNADNYGVSDKILESATTMAGHPQGENLFTSQCGGEIERSSENRGDDNGTDVILITDDRLKSTSKLVDEGAEHSSQNLAVVNHCSDEKFTEKIACTTEGDEVIQPHVAIPAVDSDSLDGNWGSFSVVSTTSDAQQPTDDTIASNQPRSLVPEEIPSMVPKPVMENEPPQNQIPVKTVVQNEQTEGLPDIQTSKEQQHISELDKGKKDKEIIDKVSNWDSGKQRTPLKTLLGEAIAKSRAESPIHENQIPAPASEPQTENVIVNADHPETEAAEEETGKEWNSLARYPVNIKTEKRSKSRPYWAPFLCCSSVNAR